MPDFPAIAGETGEGCKSGRGWWWWVILIFVKTEQNARKIIFPESYLERRFNNVPERLIFPWKCFSISGDVCMRCEINLIIPECLEFSFCLMF